MAFQPAPLCGLIEWVYDLDGQLCENTYHVEATEPLDSAMCEALAIAAYNWWAPNLGATISFNVTLLRTEVKALDAPASPFFVYSPGALAVGGAGVESVPNNVAFVVKHNTALSGRSGRGRWYVLGIPDSLVTNSHLSLAQAALYASSFDDLDTALVAEGVTPIVLSRVQLSVPLLEAVGYPITSHSFTDNVVDSQRRRLPGRGS